MKSFTKKGTKTWAREVWKLSVSYWFAHSTFKAVLEWYPNVKWLCLNQVGPVCEQQHWGMVDTQLITSGCLSWFVFVCWDAHDARGIHDEHVSLLQRYRVEWRIWSSVFRHIAVLISWADCLCLSCCSCSCPLPLAQSCALLVVCHTVIKSCFVFFPA